MSDASPGYQLSENLEDSLHLHPPARPLAFWESCDAMATPRSHLEPSLQRGAEAATQVSWKRIPSSGKALRRQREPRRPMSIYARQSAAKRKRRLPTRSFV